MPECNSLLGMKSVSSFISKIQNVFLFPQVRVADGGRRDGAMEGFSRNWKSKKKEKEKKRRRRRKKKLHTPLTSPSPRPLFCFPPPTSPVLPQASTTIAKRAPVPVSQPHILSRSSIIWRRPRSWSTRALSRVRIWNMSRVALS